MEEYRYTKMNNITYRNNLLKVRKMYIIQNIFIHYYYYILLIYYCIYYYYFSHIYYLLFTSQSLHELYYL